MRYPKNTAPKSTAPNNTTPKDVIDFFQNRSEPRQDKAHGAQQAECTLVHEHCEHRATPYWRGAVGSVRDLIN